jgi:hypothetical protein
MHGKSEQEHRTVVTTSVVQSLRIVHFVRYELSGLVSRAGGPPLLSFDFCQRRSIRGCPTLCAFQRVGFHSVRASDFSIIWEDFVFHFENRREWRLFGSLLPTVVVMPNKNNANGRATRPGIVCSWFDELYVYGDTPSEVSLFPTGFPRLRSGQAPV